MTALSIPKFATFLLLSMFVTVTYPNGLAKAVAAHQANTSVLGTWKGESLCVGNNRPACKNEIVVYRVETIPGKAGMVLLLADKIINGKREAMGKLECGVKNGNTEITCEFTINQTHGLWQYSLKSETLEGTLHLLPNKELVRQATAKRARDSDLPPAPARSEYD